MPELLCHLVGDYVLQNHWMANRKTSSWLAALVHASFYTLPFLFLTRDPLALAIIGGTHAVIDRYRLAKVWVDFWGVGVEGRVIGTIMRARGYVLGEVAIKPDLVETRWVRRGAIVWSEHHPEEMRTKEMDGYLLAHSAPRVADAPPFLGVWLLIIVDNTMHLCINHAALAWVGV